MRNHVRLAALTSALALAACSGDQLTRTFGLTRDAPDEFQVTTRAPLSMPPDFTLRPPQPGAGRPQELSGSEQAQAALVPDSVNVVPGRASSLGQQALVAAAGRPAPANIRSEVNSEAAVDAPNRSFADRLMFWRPDTPAGTAVDPAREAQRIRQNAALGQPVDSGDTPIIQRSKLGFLGNLF